MRTMHTVMERIKQYRYGFGVLANAAALAIFLLATNPNKVSVGLLVVPAILFFFMAFCLVQLIISAIKLLPQKPRKRRIVALISATFVTVILILQSTGGVSTPDVVILALILSVVSLYIDKF